MSYCLSYDVVVRINADYTNNGGRVRDPAIILSSLARPMHTFDGQELFPTVVQKAAVLLHGLAHTQGFFDGNKRTAWIVCLAYLRLHGLTLVAAADDYAADMVVDLVTGEKSLSDAQEWLINHLEERG